MTDHDHMQRARELLAAKLDARIPFLSRYDRVLLTEVAAALRGQSAQAVPDVILNLQLGIYGSAYDKHGTCRAFTYEHQPDNMRASILGRAAKAARDLTGGDSIDIGLGLLRVLQEYGFGVFQVASAPKPEGR